MNYTVRVAAKPTKFLESLQDQKLHQRITTALRGLAENPRPEGSFKLSGPESLYRIRVGDYRVVYQIQNALLLVLIAHRREVYR